MPRQRTNPIRRLATKWAFAVPMVGVCTACATPSHRDAALGTPTAPPKVPPSSTSTRAAPSPRAPKGTRLIWNAAAIERVLLVFSAQRQTLCLEHARSRAWPFVVVKLFDELLGRLEQDLVSGPQDVGRFGTRLLLQLRVTLDVETELTERRFGPAPEALRDRIRGVAAWSAHQLAKLRKNRDPNIGRERLASRSFVWPVAPIIVASPYGVRRDPIEGDVRFHAGIDLAGEMGDPIRATAGGRVTHVGWLGGYGRAVIVAHGDGIASIYAHLQSVLVRSGHAVSTDTILGQMGGSGRATGPHLHFEIRKDNDAVDPREFLNAHHDDEPVEMGPVVRATTSKR